MKCCGSSHPAFATWAVRLLDSHASGNGWLVKGLLVARFCGFGTKLHVSVDGLGYRLRFVRTGGQAPDVTQADGLIAGYGRA